MRNIVGNGGMSGFGVFDLLTGFAAREWDDDVQISSFCGWVAFERAHLGAPGASWAGAHAWYAKAAALAQTQAAGDNPAPMLWEAAHTRMLAGDDDGGGTPLRKLREMVAEAAAADERLVKGIFRHMP